VKVTIPTRKPSAPMLARIALTFARSPKRIRRFATAINAKVDIPKLTEEQEQLLFERTIGVSLDAAAAAIEGKPVLAVDSLRETTRDAVNFLVENIDELAEAVDIPFVPETTERWLAEEIAEALQERVLPWIETAQRLQ
jgi:hypothetical protein